MKKENVIDYEALGKRIHVERLGSGMSQQRLAALIQLEPSNISHIERGVGRVGLNTLVKIAIALETTPDDLLRDSLPEQCFSTLRIELKNSTADEALLYQKLIRTIESYLHQLK